MLFEKPVSVLANAISDHNFGPDPVVVVKVMQNGFKIRVMDENFVAKGIEEAKELISEQLTKLVSNLKKNDKK
jgi:hypothetical protein